MSDETGKENVIKKLHSPTAFMLRRQEGCCQTLTPKKETKLYIGLTPMQQEWYVRLQKDAHELNKLGGPDKHRL
jgi:SWI/SNF-related matrix-associated actin-dependent regulator of chromatin subfamily A member 5